MLSCVFRGSTDASVFEDFIEELLHHCGKWPELKSVLVMDNASFHHIERISDMCADAGVKLVYLPPYSPDLNPIEEFFAELKRFIRRNWSYYAEDPTQGFAPFLEWCINQVGTREESARGHFRHAGLIIDNLDDELLPSTSPYIKPAILPLKPTVSHNALIPVEHMSPPLKVLLAGFWLSESHVLLRKA
jgi:transposase